MVSLRRELSRTLVEPLIFELWYSFDIWIWTFELRLSLTYLQQIGLSLQLAS
jgi:hypothetical protein